MGFLDNTTNNIIIDAVLTDLGRQKLAAANGSFSIASFSLADDEIDYGLIKKFGRTVGKEKIEKNTPIFEAMTNQSVAMKYRLVGAENNSVLSVAYLPVLKSDSTPSLIKSVNNSLPSAVVRIDLYYNGSTGASTVPASMIQNSYKIKVPDRFFVLKNAVGGTLDTSQTASAKVSPSDPNRIAEYTYVVDTRTNATTITFTVEARNIDANTLNVYGKRISASSKRIDSFISVVGTKHGTSIDIPITYTSNV